MDHTVTLLSQYGQDALMAKIDLKAAFRLIPVQAADWAHLGICWRGQFYVDTCLPFGLRSAPALFNHYAEALDWIMANNYGAQLLHYLDDFLLVGPPGKDTCQEAMSRMLTQLDIPVASENLEGPTTALTFLGIVLDTTAQQLRQAPDKLEELTRLTRSWLSRHKATKRELLSLIGKLSFAAKVVPAGRLFLRRLIDLSTTVRKLHHHISLNAEARANIRRTLNQPQPHITCPRPEPPSPAPTEQSHGPINCNHLCHWDQTLNSRTIQVYVAAVSFLHHSMGYKSPASSNPTLRLAIRGVQRLQEPIHLKPTRLLLTVEMLGHMLQRLEAAPLKRHDHWMALNLGFFGFLRVSEFPLKNRRFDPSCGNQGLGTRLPPGHHASGWHYHAANSTMLQRLYRAIPSDCVSPTPEWLFPPQDVEGADGGEVLGELFSPDEQFRRMKNTAPGVTNATWRWADPKGLILAGIYNISHTNSRRVASWATAMSSFSPAQKGFLAYDRCSERLGLSGTLLSVVQDGATINVRTGRDSYTTNIPQRFGVKQRCPLSPILFNIVLKGILRHLSTSQAGYSPADTMPRLCR
ncbi:hypothetical protein EMCRGX_G005629 [Ephydatia muelleri]